MTCRLAEILRNELEERQLEGLFSEIEMPLVPVIADMEMAGVLLDVPYLQQMSSDLRPAAGGSSRKIYQLEGYANSTSAAPAVERRVVRQAGPADRRAEEDARVTTPRRPTCSRRSRASIPSST